MSGRRWQPGDVAKDDIGRRFMRLDDDKWVGITGTRYVGGELKPLVVIDPEDIKWPDRLLPQLRERIETVTRVTVDDRMWERILGRIQDDLFAAIDPKPDEPQGLGAVVATESDGDYIRVSVELANPWLNVQTGSQRHWDGVAATRVLSEGVQP